MKVDFLWSDYAKKRITENKNSLLGGYKGLNMLESEIGIDSIPLGGGGWALVVNESDSIEIVSDYVASYPLFFYSDSEKIVISDDSCLIARKYQLPIISDNINEMLQTGYVTGRGTVFKGIYRIEPGTKIVINKSSGRVKWNNYYSLDYRFDSKREKDELISEYDSVLINIFEEFINRLQGRTAVLPLSGGIDSRTIAVMLKRLDYKNVLCFSYGQDGSKEVSISKKVAENLGYKWFYVNYNEKKWKNFLTSKNYQDYLAFASRGASMALVQDIVAILELAEKGLIPDGSVFCPGNTQDVICGSHISMVPGKMISKRSLVGYIIAQHYILNDSVYDGVVNTHLGEEIHPYMSREEYAKQIMEWEWKNRQSKFIANSCRAYEFIGYDYDMPFWCKKNLDFWSHVPLDLILGRRLQFLHGEECIDPVARIDIPYSSKIKDPFYVALKIFLRKHRNAKIWNYGKKRRILNYMKSDDGLAGIWAMDEYKEKVAKYGYAYGLNTEVAIDTAKFLYNYMNN